MRTLLLLGLFVGSGCSLYSNLEPIDGGAPDMPACAMPPCVSDGGTDMDQAPQCQESSTCPEAAPVCGSNKQCEPCAPAGPSAECGAHHSTKPLCGPSGACVECNAKDDCAATNRTCRANACAACQSHAECTTGVCKTGGVCATATEVAYVNNASATCSDLDHASTRGAPFCQIQAAATATLGKKPFVVVEGSATAYNAVNLTATVSAIGPLTIIGPGRSANPLATVGQDGAPGVVVSASGANATVSLDGLDIIGSNGVLKRAGISCTAPAGTSALTVRNSNIHNSGGLGVDSSGCTVTVDSNVVGPSNVGGIRVTSTAFTITNNIIAGNRNGVVGVRIDDNPAGSEFAFNTVVGNGAATDTLAGGIACNAATTIRASIVAANSLTMASGTQFSGSCTLQNVVTGADSFGGATMLTPEFAGASDFRLKTPSAANTACCIDKLAAPGTPNADHDVDRTARPKGVGAMPFDVGAHEAQ